MEIFEHQDKKINFILNKDKAYSVENIKEDIEHSRKVYFVGIEDFLVPYFNIEPVMDYHWPRFNEKIYLYRLTGEKVQFTVTGAAQSLQVKYGQNLIITYEIKNSSNSQVDISSLELGLPKTLKYEGITQDSEVSVDPALSRGKLMWVKTFTIEPGGSLKLVFSVKAAETGEGQVTFLASSQNFYFEAQPLNITVTE